MKLKCPACGAAISAADINIQQMVAICPECDNVFKFDATFRQGRKIKKPAQFQVTDDDPKILDMFFKWSWRTEPPISMIIIPICLIFMLLLTVAMIADGAPFLLTLLPIFLATFLSYTLFAIGINRTHYLSDGATLTVFTEPLPFMRYEKKTISVAEIASVTVERPGYAPFPEGKAGFYDVFVHTLDGDKLRIAAYVNHEHAHFIQQELQAHVQALHELPASSDIKNDGAQEQALLSQSASTEASDGELDISTSEAESITLAARH
ncbi:MAG: hypothetical protein KF726_18120 [Anaerolineae bacterium]|nr:hypothetical protein [Anaerolineae bacterium]